MNAPCRTANLKPAAAQRGDYEPASDRCVKPAFRGYSRSDRNGHRQRQRDQRYGQAGHSIGAQLCLAVILAKNCQ